MKRKIVLGIILILEFLSLVFLYIDRARNWLLSVWPGFQTVYEWCSNALNTIVNYFKVDWLPWFTERSLFAQRLIVLVAINIVVIILYFLITGLIILAVRSHRRRALKKNGKEVHLTDEEENKYQPQLYEKRFPIRRLVSLLLPIIIFLGFILVRFDKNLCASLVDEYPLAGEGYFTIYGIYEYRLGFIGTFIDNVIAGYLGFNSTIVEKLGGAAYIEWIEIGVALLLVLVIWWLIGSIFARPFRKHHAKVLARRAKKKYVLKMEKEEYKALKKARKEDKNSSKVQELYDEAEEDINNDVQIENIAKTYDDKVTDGISEESKLSPSAKEYIDDISTGITYMGVAEEDKDEMQQPMLTRESHFVGDEEVDIKLEEEPVIETIEEEEQYYRDDDNDVTFEQYQSDRLASLSLEDKVKKYNIDIIKDDKDVVKYRDDNVAVRDYQDAILNDQSSIIKSETYFTPNYFDEEAFVAVPVIEEEEEKVPETNNEEQKEDAMEAFNLKLINQIVKECIQKAKEEQKETETEEKEEKPLEEEPLEEIKVEEDMLPTDNEAAMEDTSLDEYKPLNEHLETNDDNLDVVEVLVNERTIVERKTEQREKPQIIKKKEVVIEVNDASCDIEETIKEEKPAEIVNADENKPQETDISETPEVKETEVKETKEEIVLDDSDETISDDISADTLSDALEKEALAKKREAYLLELSKQEEEETKEEEKVDILDDNFSKNSDHEKITPIAAKDVKAKMNAYLLKGEESREKTEIDQLIVNKPITQIRQKKPTKPVKPIKPLKVKGEK